MSEEKKDIIAEIRENRKLHIQHLKDEIRSANPDAMLVDGHDDALAGYDSRGRAVYRVDHIIHTLVERDDMTLDEAYEFFDFNIAGAYVGEYTPIYMYEE